MLTCWFPPFSVSSLICCRNWMVCPTLSSSCSADNLLLCPSRLLKLVARPGGKSLLWWSGALVERCTSFRHFRKHLRSDCHTLESLKSITEFRGLGDIQSQQVWIHPFLQGAVSFRQEMDTQKPSSECLEYSVFFHQDREKSFFFHEAENIAQMILIVLIQM